MLVAAVVLYVWRHVVQDKLPMKLREQIPRTPEEARAHAELKAAPTSASRVGNAYSARSSQRGRPPMACR